MTRPAKRTPLKVTREELARAIAWSELNTIGRATCKWERDFSGRERADYRKRATYILGYFEGSSP